MLRFRLFNVPFVVTPFFWIFSAVLGSSIARGPNGLLLLAVWVACVFVSIVVHELGHALTARSFGLQPAIVLEGMFGLTAYQSGVLTRMQSIGVSLAGPAASIGLYLLVRVFIGRMDLLGLGGLAVSDNLGSAALVFALGELLTINLYWTIFNLLPVLPLDGGQVLRDVLGPRLLNTTRIIGIVIGAAVAIFAVTHGQIYLAILFGYLAFNNVQALTRGQPDNRPGRFGE